MSQYGLSLAPLYGPLYRQPFNVHTRNVRTGAISHNAHHCPECRAATKNTCYENLHWCFCIATLDRKGVPIRDAYGHEIICGERFELHSPGGCLKHPYNHGYNLIFKEAYRGKMLSPEAKGQRPVTTSETGDMDVEMGGMEVDTEPGDYTFYETRKKKQRKETRARNAEKRKTKPRTRKVTPTPSARSVVKSRKRRFGA